MKNIAFIIFIAVACIQWIVPGMMVYEQESTITNGKVFKFRTEPIDPVHPFIGRYLVLNYVDTEFTYSGDNEFEYGESVYVSIVEDSAGYAVISQISKETPENSPHYITAMIDYRTNDREHGIQEISVEFPFTRMYLEESIAPVAEEEYNNIRRTPREERKPAAAIVSVKEGTSVLTDVQIEGKSIVEIAKEAMK